MPKKPIKKPTREEVICLSLAAYDAYMRIDHEDYCEDGNDRCNKCLGCDKYNTLKKAYKIAKKFKPKKLTK